MCSIFIISNQSQIWPRHKTKWVNVLRIILTDHREKTDWEVEQIKVFGFSKSRGLDTFTPLRTFNFHLIQSFNPQHWNYQWDPTIVATATCKLYYQMIGWSLLLRVHPKSLAFNYDLFAIRSGCIQSTCPSRWKRWRFGVPSTDFCKPISPKHLCLTWYLCAFDHILL